MSKFGKCEGYTGTSCPNCGRYRLEHHSKGFDICEKCDWCVQLGEYIDRYDADVFGEDGDKNEKNSHMDICRSLDSPSNPF